MKIHANAKTCVNSRRLLVRRIEEENWPLVKAAEAAGISGDELVARIVELAFEREPAARA